MSFTTRSALRRLLVSEWNPSNTMGYDPTAARDADTHVKVHLGGYDEDFGPPQVAITDVSSTARNASGYYAMKADGSGYVQKYDERVDALAFGGHHGQLEPNADELAESLGNEVRDIAHDNAFVLYDSGGRKVAEDIAALSKPVAQPDPEYSPTRWFARVELGYTAVEEPPQRQ